MNKQEFLLRLGEALSGLSAKEREERLSFYSELIDDRMEEGLSEEEAVAAAGTVEQITGQITTELPAAKAVKQKRQWKWWEIVLLALGVPIWGSLLVAAAAVVFSAYASVWAVILSLWAVFASIAACAVYCVAAGPVFLFCVKGPQGLAVLAAGFVCAGIAIFLFFGCKAATKSTVILTRKFLRWIGKCFVKKEEAK